MRPSSRYTTQSTAATAVNNESQFKKMCKRNGVPLLLTVSAAGIAATAMAVSQILFNQACRNVSTNVASWASERRNNLCFDTNSTAIVEDVCIENVDWLKHSSLTASCVILSLITIANGIFTRKGWLAHQQMKKAIYRKPTDTPDIYKIHALCSAFSTLTLPCIIQTIIFSQRSSCNGIIVEENRDSYYSSCNSKEPCTESFYDECLRRVFCSFAPEYPSRESNMILGIQILSHLANSILLGWSVLQIYKAKQMLIANSRVAPNANTERRNRERKEHQALERTILTMQPQSTPTQIIRQ